MPITNPNPHTLATLQVQNLTTQLLPVGGGLKLQANQLWTKSMPFVQIQQELIPRLVRLAAAGKVSFQLRPGGPDIAGQPAPFNFGIIGALTAATRFAQQNYTEAAAVAGTGLLVTQKGKLQNLYASVGTAPGGSDTVAITVFVNGVATAITCTISATGVAAFDIVRNVNVKPGDLVQLRHITSGGSAADLRASVQLI